MAMTFKTLEDYVGNTPLVRLKRLPGKTTSTILGKLEGNNPAGSVKDRPAFSMIKRAQERGTIKPGDTLIEPTSGNTGIALAMCAAMMGYRMILVMPEHLSIERRQTMAAFGAEFVLTPKAGGMELARDIAEKMRDEGKGVILGARLAGDGAGSIGVCVKAFEPHVLGEVQKLHVGVEVPPAIPLHEVPLVEPDAQHRPARGEQPDRAPGPRGGTGRPPPYCGSPKNSTA